MKGIDEKIHVTFGKNIERIREIVEGNICGSWQQWACRLRASTRVRVKGTINAEIVVWNTKRRWFGDKIHQCAYGGPFYGVESVFKELKLTERGSDENGKENMYRCRNRGYHRRIHGVCIGTKQDGIPR